MDGRWPCRLLPGIVLLSLVLLHFLLPLFSQLLKTFLTLKTRVLYSHRWTPSPPERRMLILSAIISHNAEQLAVEKSMSQRLLLLLLDRRARIYEQPFTTNFTRSSENSKMKLIFSITFIRIQYNPINLKWFRTTVKNLKCSSISRFHFLNAG